MAFDHVTDIDILAREAHAVFNDPGQQLPGLAHKRSAGPVFLMARAFAHKDQPGLRGTLPEHETVAVFAELAALTVADPAPQIPE